MRHETSMKPNASLTPHSDVQIMNPICRIAALRILVADALRVRPARVIRIGGIDERTGCEEFETRAKARADGRDSIGNGLRVA